MSNRRRLRGQDGQSPSPRRKVPPHEARNNERMIRLNEERNARLGTVNTPPPGPASAAGSAASPAPVVQHGRGRYLVPIAVGAGVLGGAAYLASRRRKRAEDVGKAWVLPDGEVVVVAKREGDRRRVLTGAGVTGAVGVAGGHGLHRAALRQVAAHPEDYDAETIEAVRHGKTGRVLRRTGGVAGTLAGAAGAGLYVGARNRGMKAAERQAAVRKAYAVAWPPQSSTAVTPRTPSGPHVGTANQLKRIKGKGSRTPRTKLLVIGRGSGHGRRISKADEGWNTFGGGQERTPALSRNGIWG